jgi:hypothetical protein
MSKKHFYSGIFALFLVAVFSVAFTTGNDLKLASSSAEMKTAAIDFSALETHWDESITELNPTSPVIEYDFGQPVESGIIFSGVKIRFDVTLPYFNAAYPQTPLVETNFHCFGYHYIIADDSRTFITSPRLDPIYVTQTATNMVFDIELSDPIYDVTKIVCTYFSVSPLRVKMTTYLASPFAVSPNWESGEIYHHSGHLLSSHMVTPPTSFEFHPTDPNQLIVTMYGIQNGLFNFDTNVIVFRKPSAAVLTQVVLIPPPPNEIPIDDITISFLADIPGDTQTSLLTLSDVSGGIEQLRFAITFDSPVSELSTFGVYSYLQTQTDIPVVRRYGIGLFNTFRLDTLQKDNSNTILSIEPHTEPNRYKFNFQISSLGGSYAWIRSQLNGLFKILKCYTTPGTTPLPGQTFLKSNRLAWFLSFSPSTDINTPNLGFFTCDVIASSILSQYNQGALAFTNLFENTSRQPGSDPYFSPPHPLSRRNALLQSLFSNLAPLTIDITPQHYLSRDHFIDFNGAVTPITGTHHRIRFTFPGLFSNCKISITLPDYNVLHSTRIADPKLNAWYDYKNDGFYTSRSTPVDIVDVDPILELADDSSITRIDNQDGTITFEFLPSRLGTPMQDDLIDYQFEFDIYRKMSRSTESQYVLDNTLTFVDDGDVPVPATHTISIQGEVFDTSTFPGDSIPSLARTFSVTLGRLIMAIPPNFLSSPAINYSDKAVYPNNASFLLLVRGDNISSPHLTAYDSTPSLLKTDLLELTIPANLLDSFQFERDIDGIDLSLPFPFIIKSKTSSKLVLSVLEDYEFSTVFELPIRLTWYKPSSTTSTPTFVFNLYSDNNTQQISYDITPSFVSYAAHYSTPIINVGSMQYSSQFYFLSPRDQHDLTKATSQFVVNENTPIQIQIVFEQAVVDAADIPSSYDLLLWYYPIVNNQLSTTAILIDEQLALPNSESTINNRVDLSKISNLPLTQHAFIEVRYSFTDLDPYQSRFVTQLFTIAQKCVFPSAATSFEQIVDITHWTSICGPYGQCLANGTCRCRPGYTGELCNQAPNLCASNNCSDANTDGCSSDGKCICKNGWTGEQCRTSTQCSTQSTNQCGSHGFLIEDSTGCGKECKCLGSNWVGTACNICSLQCQNQGVLYKQCDKCGCMAGFTGDRCQCRSTIGSVTINAYSKYILQYYALFVDSSGKAISPTQDFISLSRLEEYSTLYNDLLSYFLEKLELDHQPEAYIDMGEFNSALNELQHTQLGIRTQTVGDNLSSTKLTVTIRFGCDSFNFDETMTAIQDKWQKMSEGFSKSDVIQNNFTFWGDEDAVSFDDLVPTEQTLPGDDDRYSENSAIVFNLIFVGIIVFLNLM